MKSTTGERPSRSKNATMMADAEREKLREWTAGAGSFALYDRLTRALENGRGIKLSPADLDEFVAAGGYDVISKAIADNIKQQALRRIADRK